MNSNLSRRISDIYRKNKDEGVALLFFFLPYFVYRNSDCLPANNIPVFNFHSVKPCELEDQFRYLSENNYKTLNASSFLNVINGKEKGACNNVVLTFDDGRKSLWTTAFPLLKKYNLTAISFIVPSIVSEDSEKSPTLEDFWRGGKLIEEIENIEAEIPFCNWNEIKEMHLSGLVDFQSHSMYHASVFNSNKLVDFVNPDFEASLLHSTLNPLEYHNQEKIGYGSPVYTWESNLVAKTRYIPDEKINASCIEYVQARGGSAFFEDHKWRNKLLAHFKNIRGNSDSGHYQSSEQRLVEIKNDLLEARKIIEEYLNKEVKHLCLPWYFGNELTVRLSKETGYECIYWGIMNRKSTNIIGDDPFFMKRINDYYISSLPGENRTSFGRQILNKIRKRKRNCTYSGKPRMFNSMFAR